MVYYIGSMTEESQDIQTAIADTTPDDNKEFQVETVKKPRSAAQIAALDAARHKAYAIRAEKRAQKVEVASTRDDVPKLHTHAVEHALDFVKKSKKPKRIVVVEESSSSEEEIEIRLPKKRGQEAKRQDLDPERSVANETHATDRDLGQRAERQDKRGLDQRRLEASMLKMFTYQ